MEKILINENRGQSERQLASLKALKEIIATRLVPKFNELNIGELTTELLFDTVHGCEKIEEKIMELGRIDSAKFRIESMREQIIEGASDMADTFKLFCKELFVDSSARIAVRDGLLHYIEVSGEKVDFIQDHEKILRESNCYYIEDGKQIKLHSAISAFADALNDIYKIMGERAKNKITLLEVHELLDLNNNVVVPSDNIDYGYLLNK